LRKKQEENSQNFLRLTIVEFLLKYHPAGIFFTLKKFASLKKDSSGMTKKVDEQMISIRRPQ
jgi:hypothetical protein